MMAKGGEDARGTGLKRSNARALSPLNADGDAAARKCMKVHGINIYRGVIICSLVFGITSTYVWYLLVIVVEYKLFSHLTIKLLLQLYYFDYKQLIGFH